MQALEARGAGRSEHASADSRDRTAAASATWPNAPRAGPAQVPTSFAIILIVVVMTVTLYDPARARSNALLLSKLVSKVTNMVGQLNPLPDPAYAFERLMSSKRGLEAVRNEKVLPKDVLHRLDGLLRRS